MTITKDKTEVNNTVKHTSQDFNPWIVYVVCLGIAVVFMFFFGLNSPLHTFNPFTDYNWFVTMGRSIVAGKVPYRDLFDHKGPITYFVFAIAGLFPNYQIAVWCIEIICISLFLYFCYRIARKFLSPWLSLAVVPLIMLVLSTNYCRGLSATPVEEFCLPIFAYGLLCFLDFIMDKRPATWQRSLALGICLGILFWVKFSMWEFFLFPMLIWLIMNLVRRDWKTVLRSGLIMLGGLLIVTLPIIIYFGVNGALDDLWQMYFQLNMGSYTGNYMGLNETELYIRKWKNALFPFGMGGFFITTLILGIICFAINYWKQKSGWLLLIAVVATWLIIGFFCGFEHYYIPLFTYAVLGCIYIVKYIAKLVCFKFTRFKSLFDRSLFKNLGIICLCLISLLVASPFVLNTIDINKPRENYVPLVVADIIKDYNQTAEKPASLFCYSMVDYGFYNAAGLIPETKFYARSAFTVDEFPEMYQAFDETISNPNRPDFVVVYTWDFKIQQDFLLTYYDYYYGTLEASTIKYVIFDDDSDYISAEFVILFRK